MAVKDKKRVTSKNTVENMTMTPNERILKNITELYTTGLNTGEGIKLGLKSICDDPLVNSPCHCPRKRISCMVIGNHSAGKSSFLNWYVGETVQSTGVAIETRGFSFLTSGRKRETLMGDATLHYFSHLEDIKQFGGIENNLFTEVSTSKEKNFSCTDFIDTPGLVDGDMNYPFDVASSIVWMADYVDLIIIFFDPIGQALCKRTVDVIRRLNDNGHAEKMQYYMSKADQVESELDRQRVLIQITQNLGAHMKNQHAFKLPTIFLPRADGEDPPIPNAIQDVCQDIDQAIRLTVQKNLTTLKTDCERILTRIDQRVVEDIAARAKNNSRSWQGVMFTLFSLMIFLMLAVLLLGQVNDHTLAQMLVQKLAEVVAWLTPLSEGKVKETVALLYFEDVTTFYYVAGALATMFIVCLVAIRIVWTKFPTLVKKEKAKMEEYKKYVKGMSTVREQMYKDYFKQLQTED